MTRREYSDETKAAIMAALLAGQSIGTLAGQYKIPHSTIRSWKSRQAHGESVATIATVKKEQIGEMLIHLLEVEIESLVQLSLATRDPVWIKAQSGADIAVWHGVRYDKLIRVLE